MIKSIVSKIIKDRKDYIEDLTTLKKREKAYPASLSLIHISEPTRPY